MTVKVEQLQEETERPQTDENVMETFSNKLEAEPTECSVTEIIK